MAESKVQKTSKEGPPVEERKDDKEVLMKVTCHSNGALSKKLGAFFNESHFHDVLLKLPDNKEYKAHRLVLCVWSEYFKERLQGPSRSRAPSTLVIDKLTPGEINAFEHMLRFMYTGEVTPQDDNVLDICRLTDRFKVKELRRLCEEWIGSNVGDHNVLGASARLRDAEELGLTHLTKKCREVFCHYFTRLPEATWGSLSVDHVEEILKSPEIVVEDEKHVLQKLESWVKSNGGMSKINKQVLVSRLLPQIRFRFMSAVQLQQVRDSPLGELIKEEMPGVLEDAFEFRAVAGEQSKVLGSRDEDQEEDSMDSDPSSRYKLPRLYFDSDLPGISQSRSNIFRTYRINGYNSDSRPVAVFNKDGHCWRDTREWRYECKSLQDNGDKDDPWRLKFTLTPPERQQRRYHVAFLIREAKSPGGQNAGPSVGDPELLVMVGKGTITKDEENEPNKKITMLTPPIFEKNPREVELCFVGNCFMKGVDV